MKLKFTLTVDRSVLFAALTDYLAQQGFPVENATLGEIRTEHPDDENQYFELESLEITYEREQKTGD